MTSSRFRLALVAACILQCFALSVAAAESERERDRERAAGAYRFVPAGTRLEARKATARIRVVDFGELARQAARRGTVTGPLVPLEREVNEIEEDMEPIDPRVATAPEIALPPPPPRLNVASPAPSHTFIGLDDIPMTGTGFIIIPPDVDGAVGRTQASSRASTTTTASSTRPASSSRTITNNDFWAASGGGVFSNIFDPRTLYDPINDRWIVVILRTRATPTRRSASGVSQTSDPSRRLQHRPRRHGRRQHADGPTSRWSASARTGSRSTSTCTRSLPKRARGVEVALDHRLPQLRAGIARVHRGHRDRLLSPRRPPPTRPTENTLVRADATVERRAAPTVSTGSPARPRRRSTRIGGTLSRGLTWSQPTGQILPASRRRSRTRASAARHAVQARVAGRPDPLDPGGARRVALLRADRRHSVRQPRAHRRPVDQAQPAEAIGAPTAAASRIRPRTRPTAESGTSYAHLAVERDRRHHGRLLAVRLGPASGGGILVHLARRRRRHDARPGGLQGAARTTTTRPSAATRNRWGDYVEDPGRSRPTTARCGP